MVDVDHGDPCLPDQWEYRGYLRGRDNDDEWPSGEVFPDLTNPATLGCLLALVRDAWGDVEFCMTFSPWNGQWRLEAVFYCDDKALPYRHHYEASSLAEALVAALEAANDAA